MIIKKGYMYEKNGQNEISEKKVNGSKPIYYATYNDGDMLISPCNHLFEVLEKCKTMEIAFRANSSIYGKEREIVIDDSAAKDYEKRSVDVAIVTCNQVNNVPLVAYVVREKESDNTKLKPYLTRETINKIIGKSYNIREIDNEFQTMEHGIIYAADTLKIMNLPVYYLGKTWSWRMVEQN